MIYLDYQSTTPLDPLALAAMLPFLQDDFGNSGSRQHALGQRAAAAVETARAQVAELIGAEPRDIIFTSGATEANNLALVGLARYVHRLEDYHTAPRRHIITAATEHKAVLEVCAELVKDGFEVSVLPVDQDGMIEPQAVIDAIRPETFLVSLMFANNEVGTLHDLAKIGALIKERDPKIYFHTDAAQGLSTEVIDVAAMRIDLLSASAHKLYGPKGVGALYVRRKQPRVRLLPLVVGGGQERGLRSGTLNVPGIVGFGKAAEIARENRESERARVLRLRERLYEMLGAECDGLMLNGHPTKRLAGNLNVSVAGIEANALLCQLSEVAISSGAACTSMIPEPSHVLRAMGATLARSESALRLGVGRYTTEADIASAASYLSAAIKTLRG